ncbi:integrase core domain-containing protein [Paracidovorax citrulli]|uniref:integrase core domain-containing protein n=1 Tax=Paracidovorax citrulli TaxID=80869 RepID=UPI003EBDC672
MNSEHRSPIEATTILTRGEAREVIALWRQDYNEERPHGSIGRIPPAAFATRHREPSTIDAGSVNLQNPGPLPNDWYGYWGRSRALLHHRTALPVPGAPVW